MTSVELLVDKVEQISNNKNLSKQEAIDLYNKSIVQAKKNTQARNRKCLCSSYD